MEKFTRTNIQEILRGSGLDMVQSRQITAQIIEALATALAAGKHVELRGLGSLEPRERIARTMRNPRTLAAVEVPARRAVFFTPGQELKAALRNTSDIIQNGA